MKKKKIAIIGTVGLPAKYGGFETLAEHLVKHMGDEYSITVYCSGKKYSRDQRRKEWFSARLVYLPLNANGVWSIAYDCLSILHALFFADALLVLGVSGGILFPFVRRLTRKKLIVSIDGIEWKRDKWSRPAKWYLWWAEKIAVRYSHADISDNESIQDYTAFRYKTLSHIVEYGADHTLKVAPTPEYLAYYPFLKKPYAFNVCRIEPENNIALMLDAFARSGKMPFVIIGNWNNSEYGRQLKERYEQHDTLTLLDPIYDQGKLDLIRGNATVYIHGHSAGGTNPSLVEAMYLSLPVISYGVSYNRTTTENKAWYFSTADELAEIIDSIKEEDLAGKALQMKEIADRRYTWKIISNKYSFLISQVLASNSKVLVAPQTEKLNISELLQMEMGHLAYPAHFYEKR